MKRRNVEEPARNLRKKIRTIQFMINDALSDLFADQFREIRPSQWFGAILELPFNISKEKFFVLFGILVTTPTPLHSSGWRR